MGDDFLERLRGDAGALRRQPDEVTLARIRARILATIEERPTLAQQLAAWLRPLAATLTAVALATAIAVAAIDTTEQAFGESHAEIQMAGDTYSVTE